MPYIDKDHRDFLKLCPYSASTPGELNYLISKHVNSYLQQDGRPNYEKYNSVIGVLESAKLEIYRRLVADYEDVKCKENGDVFDDLNNLEDKV